MRQLFDAGEPLRHLTWLDGGRSLVTVGQADASGFTQVTDLDAVTHVAFAPDGQTLAAADARGRVWQIDVD